ncbi:TetR/AcrR family transcriptional regulator [Flavivirga spongiicola]|uniref:TetR/AcrR family transcriptional regulator n=1 Tax=Flavivirga spongiicola TaxID=421621 RepID=A0ABU7Y1U9_9FLAO|nr:TetR/AcrR family transcriptional regulator [Flavivirga sp. MEBiC05379]MDO5981109.1 TetR/AcrR family transcriptional regulator [Flavivirga sp. MEBiC05379]
MKTKEKIKNKARELFNKKGFKNVTLREVAKSLEKSYGNITYHFKTKNELIFELYEDMVAETSEIMLSFNFQNLFHGILAAPQKTFEISMKYLFFYVDYVEVRRSYKDIYLKAEKDNAFRKENYMRLLKQLQAQKLLREELSTDDLNYLMDLSGAMRTFFFLNLHPESFDNIELKNKYVKYINNLVFPYLTKKGIEEYNLYLN